MPCLSKQYAMNNFAYSVPFNNIHTPNTAKITAEKERFGPVILWKNGPSWHICISSKGCRYGRAGHCIYCNYGYDANYSDEEKLLQVQHILSDQEADVDEIVMGSYGNYFDPDEIPWELFVKINAILAESNVSTIIFETHCNTVNKKYLDEIKRSLIPYKKNILIQMGLESSNPYILRKNINKAMSINHFSSTIKLVKSYGFGVIANVILGIPYLTANEQLQDALSTIHWAISHDVDSLTMFPLNVKKNTRVYELYQTGAYKRISHWMLIHLLTMLPSTMLPRVSLSWVGLRQKKGRDLGVLPPISCGKCKELLLDFYTQYNDKRDETYRTKLLSGIISNSDVCLCYTRFKKEIT